MEILIISGMSGAGKSRAAICLEDSGYYIVDNLPAEMMVKFAEFCAPPAAGMTAWLLCTTCGPGSPLSD